MGSNESVRKLRCPICGKEVAFEDPEMPFCSDRCRLLDLANWASEKYVITTPGGSEYEERDSSEEPEDPSR